MSTDRTVQRVQSRQFASGVDETIRERIKTEDVGFVLMDQRHDALRKLCTFHNLPCLGRKPVLVQRLLSVYAGQPAPEITPTAPEVLAQECASFDETLSHRPGPKSWKVGCKTGNDTEWGYNALRFPTKESAEQWGAGLFQRWMALKAYEVHESDESVNVDERGVLLKTATPTVR